MAIGEPRVASDSCDGRMMRCRGLARRIVYTTRIPRVRRETRRPWAPLPLSLRDVRTCVDPSRSATALSKPEVAALRGAPWAVGCNRFAVKNGAVRANLPLYRIDFATAIDCNIPGLSPFYVERPLMGRLQFGR